MTTDTRNPDDYPGDAPSPIDRIPPNALEAEMALLGSILVDRDMMAVVTAIIQPRDFYASLHETIYRALLTLYDDGQPIDKVSLAESLRAQGMLDKIGGLAYVTKLMDAVPTASSAEYYAKLIKEKSLLRDYIQVSTEIQRLAYDGETDVPETINEIERRILAISQSQANETLVSTADPGLLLEVFNVIEARSLASSNVSGVTSGFPNIDAWTTGFHSGELIVVAARPAMGKTALALNMAIHAARAGFKGAFFSLEMLTQEIMERLISTEASIDSTRLRAGNLARNEWERFGYAMEQLAKCGFHIDQSGSVTAAEIRSRLRRLKAKSGLDICFVDYLQLVSGAKTAARSNANRTEVVSEISRTLKETAMELKIPIVALSQLNRALETRQDKRPMLSDLRESGSIEQDASLVAFLYRDSYYNPDTSETPDLTEFIIAKQRSGKTGTINLRFHPQYTLFEPYGDDRVAMGETA